ncbi:hypothetical protein RHSIM_Rhsim12G0068500 [Rhododendron simsii]|uniref:14-3-3 domain-containing protein n=1 Tax=Rhododendron simsii TaxID=118357 RepID=A0A834G355_RHOSS|nr:hypothetical protein RHSIM_Rhsim12G0068500 [Rhododendron simsii]
MSWGCFQTLSICVIAEMVESMKNVAKLDVELTDEGKKPVRGYKNVIGARRASWHIMSSIEQKEETKGNDLNVKIIKGYRQKVEEELSKICNDILTIIDKHLIPSFKLGEATVFYYKILSPVLPKGLVFGSGDHGNIERVTVENTDHLCIDDTDGPTAMQIKSLNAETHYLRTELASTKPIEAVPSVASPKPTWTDVVTQDPGGPRLFLFKFSQADAHKRVIASGPWLFGDKLLVLKPWTPPMELRKEQFAKVPISVQLYQVPSVLWNAAGLSYIASAIGIPLYADALTESCKRLSYARLCVEVEVGSVLPETIDVEYCGLTATVAVKYPWRPVKCLECHVFGHSEDQCVVKAKVTKPKTEWVRKGALASLEEVSLPIEEVILTQLALDFSIPVSEKSLGKQTVVSVATVPECVSSCREMRFGYGSVFFARSGNSFSVLAELDHIAGKAELEGVDPVLAERVPLDSPDLPYIVVPTKKGRGRGKGKVDPPIPKKGVGGRTKP